MFKHEGKLSSSSTNRASSCPYCYLVNRRVGQEKLPVFWENSELSKACRTNKLPLPLNQSSLLISGDGLFGRPSASFLDAWQSPPLVHGVVRRSRVSQDMRGKDVSSVSQSVKGLRDSSLIKSQSDARKQKISPMRTQVCCHSRHPLPVFQITKHNWIILSSSFGLFSHVRRMDDQGPLAISATARRY